MKQGIQMYSILFLLVFPSIFALEKDNLPDASSRQKYSDPPVAEMPETDWKLSTMLSVPFRGFEVQTGPDSETIDPLGSISYSPSPSLEGAFRLTYRNLGFTYRHTLAAGSLSADNTASESINQEYRLGLFLSNHLFEVTRQRISGMQTSLVVEGSDFNQTIARPDIKYTDTRLRWMYGLPILGADKANSLANFYTEAEIDSSNELSFDVLFSVEAVQQRIGGDSPFVPRERQARYGSGSSLTSVESSGLGAGLGFGMTAHMGGKSYMSLAAILGASYNLSDANYADRSVDISGAGAFLSARMSVQHVFGPYNRHNVGVRLNLDSWSIPAQENRVVSTSGALSLNYGIGF
jgi:hypothetical protein